MMENPFPDLMMIAGLALLLAAGWAGTVAFTYWDVHRRGLSNLETFAWVALTIFFPLFGFIAYIFARLLARFFTPREEYGAMPGGQRVTALKPQPTPQPGAATYYARELSRETRPSPPPHYGAAQRRPQQLFLTATLGPCSGKQFSVDYLPLLIGRGNSAEIRLDEDLAVSRGHAKLYEYNGALRIQDQNSSHGTCVNGRAVQDMPLGPGDRIQLGETELLVTYTEE